MVYGFVKQSAGHIMIYSEEGHGTTIKMYLPPATGTSLAAEPAHAPAHEGGHETILVVEDDKLVRDYVLTQLHSLGYVTLDAANAAEALAIVNAGNPFDLLFTDVIMPGLNGRQLANEILKVRPGLKVLFTSGYTENAIIHHGRLDEGVLLLAKPYRKSDMADHDPQSARRLSACSAEHQGIRRYGISRYGTQACRDASGHHDPDQIGGVPRSELLHDIGAVVLDGARADPELTSRFLVGSTGGELLQHLAFAPRQRLASGEMQRRDPRRGIFRLPARIGLDRLVEPGDDFAAAERLFDEVQRAALDGADRHGDVALARDHEDRRRIVLAVQLLQNVEAGFAGDMHVEQDAGRRPGSRNRQQRGAVGKADDLIAARRQNHRKRVANGGIVIDYENLPAGRGFLSHVSSSMRSET